MKRTMTGLLMGLVLAFQAQATEVKTVAAVDLDRYLGLWYEVASFPNYFQRKCTGDVSAQYNKREDGRIEVINRCRLHDGKFDQAIGLANTVEGSGNAKLRVKFTPSWLSWLPIGWGDYWIIGLAPDYSYAVVSDSKREYLWILSRTPSMTEQHYKTAVDKAAAQGFDVKKLVKTRQGQ